MPARDARVYFAAADRQLESVVSIDVFERNLVLDMLFQAGLVVPDIFCFISNRLQNHINRAAGRLSLFEAGVQRGLISPAFRNPRAGSFRQGLAIIRENGIQGVIDSADTIADRLDSSAADAAFSPTYWPETSVAGSFEAVLEAHLAGPDSPRGALPEESSSLELWKQTERWRRDCLDVACVRRTIVNT